MTRRGAQLSLALVAAVVGVLLIGQLRSQAPAIELSALSTQELADLIGTLRAGNAQLTAELTELRERIADYERVDVEGRSSVTLRQEDYERLSAFAGLLPIEGQGIVLGVQGGFSTVNVTDLIHELRAADAEAISIDGIRITASSVPVRGTGTASIQIDGVEIDSSLEILAIGSPEGLAAALERPGGVLSILEQSIGATYEIEPREHLTLPATERDLTPQVARPVE